MDFLEGVNILCEEEYISAGRLTYGLLLFLSIFSISLINYVKMDIKKTMLVLTHPVRKP